MIGFYNFLDLVHPVVKSENINNSEKVTEKAVGRRKKLIGIKDHILFTLLRLLTMS